PPPMQSPAFIPSPTAHPSVSQMAQPPPVAPSTSNNPPATWSPVSLSQLFDQRGMARSVAYANSSQTGELQPVPLPGTTQQEQEEAMNIALRNRVIPRAVPQPSSEEPSQDTSVVPNAQGEYDVIQHLSKIPAKVTVKELIEKSPSHWQAIFKFLQSIKVSADLPADNLTQAVLSLNLTKSKTPSLVFSDEEWAPAECRSLPLCISITLNGTLVDSVLVDTGASINVCPSSTFELLGVDAKELQKVATTITAYDNTKRGARGGVKMQLKVRPATMMTP